MSEAKGTTLCVKHAREATRRLAPSGECEPAATWKGGYGNDVTCDVLVAPERVARYLEHVRRAM